MISITPIRLKWVLIWHPLPFSLYLRHGFGSESEDGKANRVYPTVLLDNPKPKKNSSNYSAQSLLLKVNPTYSFWNLFQIKSAEMDDGGNYTCAPPNIHPHSVIINIMDTEGKYAAVYRDGNSADTMCSIMMLKCILIIIYCGIFNWKWSLKEHFSK